MASVIHSLWEKGDRTPLILPSTVPIDDARVQSELTRYLPDNWAPIIENDVDGPNSLPLKIDAEQPNLGKLHATRRVALTIYLGSAGATALCRNAPTRFPLARPACVTRKPQLLEEVESPPRKAASRGTGGGTISTASAAVALALMLVPKSSPPDAAPA